MSKKRKDKKYYKELLHPNTYRRLKSIDPNFANNDSVFGIFSNQALTKSMSDLGSNKIIGTAFANTKDDAVALVAHGTRFGNIWFGNSSSINQEALFTIMYNENMLNKDMKNAYFISCFGGKNLGRDMRIYGTDISIKSAHSSRIPINFSYPIDGNGKGTLFYTGAFTSEDAQSEYLFKSEIDNELSKYKFTEEFINNFSDSSESKPYEQSISSKDFKYIQEKYKDYFFNTNKKYLYYKLDDGKVEYGSHRNGFFDTNKYYKKFFGNDNKWAISYEEALGRLTKHDLNMIKSAADKDALAKILGGNGTELNPIDSKKYHYINTTHRMMNEFYISIGAPVKDYGKTSLFDETVEMAKEFMHFRELYENNKGKENFNILDEILKRKGDNVLNTPIDNTQNIPNNNIKERPVATENSKDIAIKDAIEALKKHQEQKTIEKTTQKQEPSKPKTDKPKKQTTEKTTKEPVKETAKNPEKAAENKNKISPDKPSENVNKNNAAINKYNKHIDDFNNSPHDNQVNKPSEKQKNRDIKTTRKESDTPPNKKPSEKEKTPKNNKITDNKVHPEQKQDRKKQKNEFSESNSRKNRKNGDEKVKNTKNNKEKQRTKKSEKPTPKTENTEKNVKNTQKSTEKSAKNTRKNTEKTPTKEEKTFRESTETNTNTTKTSTNTTETNANTVNNDRIKNKKLDGSGKKAVSEGTSGNLKKVGIAGALAAAALITVGAIASSGNDSKKNDKKNKKEDNDLNSKNDSLMYNDNNSDIAYNITKYRYGNTDITKPYTY